MRHCALLGPYHVTTDPNQESFGKYFEGKGILHAWHAKYSNPLCADSSMAQKLEFLQKIY